MIEFLHQSVQEFFAARYIKSRPEELAIKFYQLILEKGSWKNWDQVLRFLSQIDRFRASRFFYIPAILQSLDFLESKEQIANSDLLCKLVTDSILVRQVITDGIDKSVPIVRYVLENSFKKDIYRLQWLQSRLFTLLFQSRVGASKPWVKCFDGKQPGQAFTYTQIAIHSGQLENLKQELVLCTRMLKDELDGHFKMVAQVNSSGDFMGI